MISHLIALIISYILATNAQYMTSECHLVQKIYRSMGGNGTEESACCNIAGAECFGDNVIKIIWADRNLTGVIPAAISQLMHLEKLILTNNGLNGNIPPVLGRLTKLKSLTLSSNQLSGPVPIELENLISLEELKIDVEEFCGDIPQHLLQFTRTTRGACGGPQLKKQNVSIGGNKFQHGDVPQELNSNQSSTTIAHHHKVTQIVFEQNLQQDNAENLAPQPTESHNLENSHPQEVENQPLSVSEDDNLGDEISSANQTVPAPANQTQINFQLEISNTTINHTIPPDHEEGNVIGSEIRAKYSYGFGEAETSSGTHGITSITTLMVSIMCHNLIR